MPREVAYIDSMSVIDDEVAFIVSTSTMLVLLCAYELSLSAIEGPSPVDQICLKYQPSGPLT